MVYVRNVGRVRCERHIKGTMGAKGAQEWRVHKLGWVCKSVLCRRCNMGQEDV